MVIVLTVRKSTLKYTRKGHQLCDVKRCQVKELKMEGRLWKLNLISQFPVTLEDMSEAER